jgi:hypothetical protein
MVLVLEKGEKERLFPLHPLVMELLQIAKDYEPKINPEVFFCVFTRHNFKDKNIFLSPLFSFK